MKLSEQLRQDHESGDFGKALEGYAERAGQLECTIEMLLDSAHPHPTEHIKMHHAWEAARQVLCENASDQATPRERGANTPTAE